MFLGKDEAKIVGRLSQQHHQKLLGKKYERDRCYSTTTVKEVARNVSKVTITFSLPALLPPEQWHKIKSLLPSLHEFQDLKALQEHFLQGQTELLPSDGNFIGKLLVNRRDKPVIDILAEFKAFQSIRYEYPFFEVMIKTIFEHRHGIESVVREATKGK